MAKTMTAPQQKPMTDGQIDDLANKVRDAARKHRDELGSEDVQAALGTDNLGMVLYARFRELVEKKSDIFTRMVSGINRDQSPWDAIRSVGREGYQNPRYMDTMPRGEGECVVLTFFKLDYNPNPAELNAEYEHRGLQPDPRALLRFVQEDPSFTDGCPVICQWDPGEEDTASFIVLRTKNDGKRIMSAGRSHGLIRDCRYRFAGVIK